MHEPAHPMTGYWASVRRCPRARSAGTAWLQLFGCWDVPRKTIARRSMPSAWRRGSRAGVAFFFRAYEKNGPSGCGREFLLAFHRHFEVEIVLAGAGVLDPRQVQLHPRTIGALEIEEPGNGLTDGGHLHGERATRNFPHI